MRKWHIWIGMIGVLFILTACNDLPIETDMSEKIADFSFTTQDNETLSLEDLHGEWWIADFIFTNCETVCLPMTHNMAQLQKELEKNDLSIEFVSFSVDPDFDTPEILKEYGEQYEANFDTWSFLTGYDVKTVKELSIKSFRALLKEPEYGSDQVTHDIRFFLVSPEGEVVKGYDGTKSENIDKVIEDLKKLQDNDLL
ncbi:SCO family protein [Pseudogracilibacillus auburnensis]|uniref:Protein SCO1/2 n=1 Tax=Pseudogracilibacillus auburnensis TaxID=1494959 RepID=A0A2V3VZS6_9BACI|nr:SCO family protein [Pseudogracilibacillus auburnensis]MBO1002243.1 SCO family protein [Pseudogracilibacillus auburnensis]PXW87573.1 protein SCO1/2 [Pseudogracilibacillus auburnensis]